MNAVMTAPATGRASAQTVRPMSLLISTVSPDEVRELIDAAGPLTICDIAGGLAVSVRAAVPAVRRMLSSGCLRRDEFDRYRLWGGCR
jgi:hypothetical protein